VRHRVVDGDWPATEQLVADEESLTACWAWEQFYLGMAITGTIHNELRLPPAETAEAAAGAETAEAAAAAEARKAVAPVPDPAHKAKRPWRWLRSRTAAATRPQVRQHEPSGGGRSIPQHRRMYAQAREPGQVEPIEQLTEDGFRRTWLRRTPADVAEAGRRLGQDVTEMVRPDLALYPEPSNENCPPCLYLHPCLAQRNGRDEEPILRTAYRRRPPEPPEEGRLGGRAWGMGRGAAPPRFPSARPGPTSRRLGDQLPLDDASPRLTARASHRIYKGRTKAEPGGGHEH